MDVRAIDLPCLIKVSEFERNKTLADVLNRFAEGLVAADAGEANALGLSDPRVIAQFEQIRTLLFVGDERTDAISRSKLRDALSS